MESELSGYTGCKIKPYLNNSRKQHTFISILINNQPKNPESMKKILHVTALSFLLAFAYQQSQAQWSYDSVSFENPVSKIVINPMINNLWQIGNPQKTFFDSAHSGIKAILTDTLNSYQPKDTSSFTYIIRDPYTKTCLTCMQFWHKYDMDTVGDKGIIDASYDGGNSWIMVKDTSGIMPWWSFFYWEQDYHEGSGNYSPHKLITSGTSDDWIRSKFCWQWYLPEKKDTIIIMPDSLMIRFTFISDSILKNKEGWMIDDIITSSGGSEVCSGIEENENRAEITVVPNPFSFQTILRTNKVLNHSTLLVYNAFGQKVKQLENISGQTIPIFRENLPEGIYFILLTENNKTLTKGKLLITD